MPVPSSLQTVTPPAHAPTPQATPTLVYRAPSGVVSRKPSSVSPLQSSMPLQISSAGVRATNAPRPRLGKAAFRHEKGKRTRPSSRARTRLLKRVQTKARETPSRRGENGRGFSVTTPGRAPGTPRSKSRSATSQRLPEATSRGGLNVAPFVTRGRELDAFHAFARPCARPPLVHATRDPPPPPPPPPLPPLPPPPMPKNERMLSRMRFCARSD